jgi:type I restriction enzyme S subunit
MSRWPVIKLGDVLKLDLEKEPIDPFKSYGMVGVLSFGKGLFKREAIENGNTSYKYFLRLKSHHIVMSQLFGWEGALALSTPEFEGCFLSPQFPTFICDESQVKREFLGWLMKQPRFWNDLGSRTKGMGDRRRTLNPAAFFACQIPQPSLAEQQAIVARLDAVAEKARQVEAKLDEIEADINALCRGLVFSPPNGSAHLISMRELLTLRRPDVLVNREQIYHFAGVYSFGRGVFRSGVKSGSDFAYDWLSTLRTGDFTYPKLMAWEGALGVVPPECDGHVVSPEFPVFGVNTDIVLPETLDVYFRTPQIWAQLAEISTGTNQRRRRLQPSAFLDYKMPVPSMSSQTLLREVLQRGNEIKRDHQATRHTLKALLPSMLEQIFSR